MPAPTDHPVRRAQLTHLAIDLIAECGLPATTIRALANRAGYSTAVVTYYFANKRELLMAIYEMLSASAVNRFAESVENPDDDFKTTYRLFMPIGPEAQKSWRVNFAFWSLALNDEEFASRQRHWMSVSEDLLEKLILKHKWPVNARRVANQLMVQIMGYAIRAAFEPDWDDAYTTKWLDETVAAMLLEHRSPTAGGACVVLSN